MRVKDIAMIEWQKRWAHVNLDEFSNVGEIQADTMNELDNLCNYSYIVKQWKNHVNSDYRANDTGEHGKGKAIDLVFYKNKLGDVNVFEQFIFALRFNEFGGVGFYPYWKYPGIHVDTRPMENYRALWWRDKNGIYRAGDDLNDILPHA